MKIVQINTVCNKGSTGKICMGISKLLCSNNIENIIFYTDGKCDYEYSQKYASRNYIRIQALKSRLIGNYGFNSKFSTIRLIKLIKSFSPDIVHIHNIHGHDLNFLMFVSFLKKTDIKLVYTFHDCWPFTGYCPHFTMANCDKWINGCNHCELKKEYSWFFDKSKKNYERKKKAFYGSRFTIVTPSLWLKKIVENSFIGYTSSRIEVINNGIDLDIFKPLNSPFKKQYGIEGKHLLLGVADSWGKRKGLDVFIELSKRLSDEYKIVLVGTDTKVDKYLPNTIISIHKTQNQIELAKIYSAADLFLNPTREDNYPTVNMESLACGTPVLTFKTGGSPEIIDESCGCAVECDDVDAFEKAIVLICKTSPFSKENCLNRAKNFDMEKRFLDYVNLYKNIS